MQYQFSTLYLTLSTVGFHVSTYLAHGTPDIRLPMGQLEVAILSFPSRQPRHVPGQLHVVCHPALDHLWDRSVGRASAERWKEPYSGTIKPQLHSHQGWDGSALLVDRGAVTESADELESHDSEAGQDKVVHLSQVGQPGWTLLGGLVDALEGVSDALGDAIHGGREEGRQSLHQVAARKGKREDWSIGSNNI